MNKPNLDPDLVGSDDDTASHVALRQDAAGRYCLSDLHQAAGGAPRHDPSSYLELEETQELIMLLREEAGAHVVEPVVTPDGPDGPRFVSDELAIDYTTWLSPQAKLIVYEGLRANRERLAARGSDITTGSEMLEQAMVRERERQMRAGCAKPH